MFIRFNIYVERNSIQPVDDEEDENGRVVVAGVKF